jgi:serine/threonine protein kinase
MSEDSIDLIQKMLDRDLSTRPTMSQVLAHPVLSVGAYSDV